MALLLALLIPFVGLAIYAYLFVGRRSKNLPPGPPTLPIIGNLHQIPTKGAHLKFTEWSKTYGGIYSLKIGTGTAVVLTDRKYVKQLLDKKSNIYSERPHSYVSHNLITGGDHLLVMHYGNVWRSFRKIIHQFFMEKEVEAHHITLQNAEAVQMIHDYMVQPEQHMRHPKRFSNSIIMSCLFGIRTPSIFTSHMTRLYDLMENWSVVMEPGNTPPVDIYPILHWIPQQLFGNWRARASNVGDEMNKLYSDMLTKLETRRQTSGSKGSFMDGVLDQNEKLNLNRHELYFLGGVLMEGGSDTSSSIIISFVQAMTKWPHLLARAQEEMDRVVGEDRSPLWSDYDKLPYIAACVKESMRWRPVAPTGFPHALSEDDWVDGYHLPAGTIVFINAYGLHHDASIFPSPSVYDPEHYLRRGKAQYMPLAPELAASADYAARDHYGYGAGRRLCPGIHVAERNLWLALAKLVWAFSFRLPSGAEEIDTENETGYSEGFLVCAKDFPCEIRVRGEKRAETIKREFAEAEREVFARFQAGE